MGRIKSKIEKLERIPDDKRYYDESDFVKEVIEKINMIIDYLNTQPQTEETLEERIANAKPHSLIPVTEEELKQLKEKDTPEEWVCTECGFDDCYPYKNSKDFGLMYCPECKKLVKLLNK